MPGEYPSGRDAARKVGKKAARTATDAATTVIRDLLSWLKETLIRGVRYIPVKAGKWLKMKAGQASWAKKSEVPEERRRQFQGDSQNTESEFEDEGWGDNPAQETPFDTDTHSHQARKTILKNSHDLKAARHISENSRMKATAKQAPGVVDCDTALGVELKAAAFDGSLDSTAAEYDVSPSEVGEIIGPELAARAGYNTFGDSLPGEIGSAEADAETGEAGDAGDGSGEGNGANPQSGRPSPGTESSHVPTSSSSSSSSGSGSGGRPSPGSDGSHIPTSGGSGGGDSGSGGSTGSGPGAGGNSGGAGTGSGGSGSGSPGAGGG